MSIIHVTKDTFDEKVLNADEAVLVDFWATWCGPCRMIAPVLEELAEERADMTVAKVDVDQETELAMRYGVTSIPTMLLFKNGSVAAKTLGYMEKETLIKELGL